MYLPKETPIDRIVKTMITECYDLLNQFLYDVENTSKTKDSGKLFKIKPILHSPRNSCFKSSLNRINHQTGK